MISIITILSIVVVVGFVVYGILVEEEKRKEGEIGDIKTGNKDEKKIFVSEKVAGQIEEKEKNKETILNLLEREGKITNDQIEKVLGVSDTSVGRYLDELESEGKIKQVGETGRGVYYIRI